MNRKEAIRLNEQEDRLEALGFTNDEARALRRISMTLQRWHELECGDSNDYGSWHIERDGDEDDSKPYMVRISHREPDIKKATTRYAIPDRETGAKKRLARILADRNERYACEVLIHGKATAYVQTDPRGAALYILRPGDVPTGEDVSAYYSNGVCVY